MTAPVQDPGLQAERTELAWRRTLLALAIGALVSMRVLSDVLGGWAIALGAGGVLVASALWIATARRHRLVTPAETAAGDPRRGPDGLLLAMVSAFSGAGALLALVALFFGNLR